MNRERLLLPAPPPGNWRCAACNLNIADEEDNCFICNRARGWRRIVFNRIVLRTIVCVYTGNMVDVQTCSVCYRELFANDEIGATTNCRNHVTCIDCATRWANQRRFRNVTCPFCRSESYFIITSVRVYVIEDNDE